MDLWRCGALELWRRCRCLDGGVLRHGAPELHEARCWYVAVKVRKYRALESRCTRVDAEVWSTGRRVVGAATCRYGAVEFWASGPQAPGCRRVDVEVSSAGPL